MMNQAIHRLAVQRARRVQTTAATKAVMTEAVVTKAVVTKVAATKAVVTKAVVTKVVVTKAVVTKVAATKAVPVPLQRTLQVPEASVERRVPEVLSMSTARASWMAALQSMTAAPATTTQKTTACSTA
jgi:hypothetical protein